MATKTEPKEAPAQEPATEVELNEAHLNEYVTIVVPRALAKAEQVLFAAVNGEVYNIPRGKAVSVPRYVAQMIEAQQRAKDNYEQSVSDTYDNQAVQYLNGLDG